MAATNRPLKILLFGATGSAGGSTLRVCLASPFVTEVRALVRRTPELEEGIDPGKLRVILHSDYLDYSAVEEAFAGVDACFYCLGISVTQVSGEPEYRKITHDFALAAARVLKAKSPQAVFHFISGQSASLDSRMMWARVKAETERDLLALDPDTCRWRPAAIDGIPSKSEPRIYKIFRPLYPLLSPIRSLYISGKDLGKAMLQATREDLRGQLIDNRGIRDLADRAGQGGKATGTATSSVRP
ncbi:MAG: NAD(P)H-binding protein [Acidobacteriota bacterium]